MAKKKLPTTSTSGAIPNSASAAGGTSVDASRGTGLWALNQLRSDALPRLMEDLLYLEPVGLLAENCQKVQTALKRMWIHAADIPDRTLLPISIQHDMERFLKTYEQWNDP